MNTLNDLIQSHINNMMAQMYTSMPARVVAVKTAGSSTVLDVQPLLNRITDAGQALIEPVLGDVIVKWPSGGGCFITFPIEVGDIVDLNFSMRGTVSFKESDGSEPSTPFTERRFSRNDAFATPCMKTYSEGIEVDPDGVDISSGATEIRILKDGTIELGEGAAERLVLGDAFLALYNALSVPTGVGPSGPPIQPMVDTVHLSQITKTKLQ